MSLAMSPAIDKLAAALAKAQGAIQDAEKSRKNPAFGSKYSTLGDIWDAIKSPLTENGLALSQFPTTSTEEGKVGLTTILLHSSGQFIQDTVESPIVKKDPQGVGSALTYLRRYSAAAIVGVCSDDDDGNAASGKATPAQAATTRNGTGNGNTNGAKPVSASQITGPTEAQLKAEKDALIAKVSAIAKERGVKAGPLCDAVLPGCDRSKLTIDQWKQIVAEAPTVVVPEPVAEV